MTGTGIQVAALTQRYGVERGLGDVSFSIGDGVTALVGVNGAGKSTLLRTLAGAQRPTSGTVTITGVDPYGRRRRDALRRASLMPQSADFPKNLTAQEVVASVAWFKGASSRAATSSAREALARVGLEERMTSRMGQLSGGMARRVALAQAIVSEPEVLLLDEPSTGLDPEQRRAMISLVKTLSARIVVFSSHVMEDIEDVAESVLILDEGRLVHQGSLRRLQERGTAASTPVSSGSMAEIGFLDVLAEARSGVRG